MLYAKATGLLKWPLRCFSKQLIPRVEAPKPKSVFRNEPATTKVGTIKRGSQKRNRAA